MKNRLREGCCNSSISVVVENERHTNIRKLAPLSQPILYDIACPIAHSKAHGKGLQTSSWLIENIENWLQAEVEGGIGPRTYRPNKKDEQTNVEGDRTGRRVYWKTKALVLSHHSMTPGEHFDMIWWYMEAYNLWRYQFQKWVETYLDTPYIDIYILYIYIYIYIYISISIYIIYIPMALSPWWLCRRGPSRRIR